jgi:hypothetical protein
MFGANLLDEYILAQERYGFSLDQMRELAANAVEASFLPPPRNCNSSRASSNTAELVPAVQWSFLSIFFPLILQRTAQWKTELRKTPVTIGKRFGTSIARMSNVRSLTTSTWAPSHLRVEGFTQSRDDSHSLNGLHVRLDLYCGLYEVNLPPCIAPSSLCAGFFSLS